LEIWSGGQTGVDRAALDAALELGYATGGWIPKGRRAEDGAVPLTYAVLREAVTADYDERTRLNVRDTDATLVMSWGEPGGGTRETSRIARELGRPLLITDLEAADAATIAGQVRDWLASLGQVDRLNVAGPRASHAPLAYERAREALMMVLGTERRHESAGTKAGPPTR
jgi:predicted Rossmann-fold nucleotide-binding protein